MDTSEYAGTKYLGIWIQRDMGRTWLVASDGMDREVDGQPTETDIAEFARQARARNGY